MPQFITFGKKRNSRLFTSQKRSADEMFKTICEEIKAKWFQSGSSKLQIFSMLKPSGISSLI